mgnify:CR=1 FL=1
MKTTTSRTIILCLFLAIFGGLSGYYTYDNVTKCNDYYRDIPSTVFSVNYTNITQYGIMYCNECQNGGSFPPCNVLINTNKTGSCHINKKMNCIDDGEFTWIDENGRLHYENYDGHNKYNSLSHCYVDEFQLYRFIIGVDYQLNNENRTGHFGINCNQPSTTKKCYDDVIEYYKKLVSNYPIQSIEDPFAEEDWEAWKKITKEIGKNVQIVGDDLFVTNVKRLDKGIKEMIDKN